MGQFSIQVDCYCGYRGDQEPRQIRFGSHSLAVAAILDRWIGPDHRYVELLGEDGAIYRLRHDTRSQQWALVHRGCPLQTASAQPMPAGLSAPRGEASA